VTAYSIIGLLPKSGRVIGGEVLWDGRDLCRLSERERAHVRGSEIAMIFQNPREALNPLFTVGTQISQVLALRRGMRRKQAREEALELLRRVKIPDPERSYRAYAHELSGGMAQRVMIALALSCRPRLLIADEATTGLDVTTQRQIVDLLRELRARTQMAILLITHDLVLAAELCDRIAILYAGRVAEVGPVEDIFGCPRHPYAAALLESRPRLGMSGDIPAIPGQVADLSRPPSGCRFHPRCPNAQAVCKESQPPLQPMVPHQLVACHNPVAFPQEVAARNG
jgi:oligopeptide/dipeptide ABC transporter ATP-binding protein